MDYLALVRPTGSKIKGKGRSFRALGVDLGTTNSTIAEARWVRDDSAPPRVRCIEVDQPTREGTYTHVLFPSVVAIYSGKAWVGEGAKRLRTNTPELELEPGKNLFFECKNDIGVKKTYNRAPEEFRSAADIGGKVLAALRGAALADDPGTPDRVVVTVPASFQVAQRRDTIEAARLAGIELAPGDLLDEPIAAFLDYLFTHPAEDVFEGGGPLNLVVFDFGGGTCDVAVFRVAPTDEGRITASTLAVSRYHRLGGGDIDAAIVHEVLIPELVAQNALGRTELGFEDKKRRLEPALLSLAEALKISLCTEIARLEAFNHYGAEERKALTVTQPAFQCHLPDWDRAFTLRKPSLSAARFEELLKPFLDRDLLYARDTEYRMTCSIFAPLQDALDRAGTERSEVGCCLMAGGSSLIPQVRHAVESFFEGARQLSWPDADSIQTAVARGASLHALSLALFGKGLIQPVNHDALSLRTDGGLFSLVPKGVELPWPAGDGYAHHEGLSIPVASIAAPVPLLVELLAGEETEAREVFTAVAEVPPPVSAGEPLYLEYRFDENQVLDLVVGLANAPEVRKEFTVENPLTNVVNPNATRMKLDALEEALRRKEVPANEVPDKHFEAAGLMRELGHCERALAQLAKLLGRSNRPDAEILITMASLAGEMGDFEKEEKLLRETAASAPAWGGPWFNLALSQKRRDQPKAALESIGEALRRESPPPYFVLRAMIDEMLGRPEERDRSLTLGLAQFGRVSDLGDWQLGWLITATGMTGDKARLEEAKAEQQRRLRSHGTSSAGMGVLPTMQQGRLMVM